MMDERERAAARVPKLRASEIVEGEHTDDAAQAERCDDDPALGREAARAEAFPEQRDGCDRGDDAAHQRNLAHARRPRVLQGFEQPIAGHERPQPDGDQPPDRRLPEAKHHAADQREPEREQSVALPALERNAFDDGDAWRKNRGAFRERLHFAHRVRAIAAVCAEPQIAAAEVQPRHMPLLQAGTVHRSGAPGRLEAHAVLRDGDFVAVVVVPLEQECADALLGAEVEDGVAVCSSEARGGLRFPEVARARGAAVGQALLVVDPIGSHGGKAAQQVVGALGVCEAAHQP